MNRFIPSDTFTSTQGSCGEFYCSSPFCLPLRSLLAVAIASRQSLPLPAPSSPFPAPPSRTAACRKSVPAMGKTNLLCCHGRLRQTKPRPLPSQSPIRTRPEAPSPTGCSTTSPPTPTHFQRASPGRASLPMAPARENPTSAKSVITAPALHPANRIATFSRSTHSMPNSRCPQAPRMRSWSLPLRATFSPTAS